MASLASGSALSKSSFHSTNQQLLSPPVGTELNSLGTSSLKYAARLLIDLPVAELREPTKHDISLREASEIIEPRYESSEWLNDYLAQLSSSEFQPRAAGSKAEGFYMAVENAENKCFAYCTEGGITDVTKKIPQSGVMIFKCGTVCIGRFVDGAMSSGVVIYPNGDKIIGQFNEGQPFVGQLIKSTGEKIFFRQHPEDLTRYQTPNASDEVRNTPGFIGNIATFNRIISQAITHAQSAEVHAELASDLLNPEDTDAWMNQSTFELPKFQLQAPPPPTKSQPRNPLFVSTIS